MAKYIDLEGLALIWAEIKKLFNANNAMQFKGTIGASSANPTFTALPTTQFSAGWTYKVVSAGSYAGQDAHVGDLIMCIKDNETDTAVTASSEYWTVAHINEDGTVTTSATSLTAGALLVGDGGNAIKVAAQKGSATKGIYIDSAGKPQQMTYAVEKDVPSGAKFTDQSTTLAGHYAPGTPSVSATGNTLSFGADVVTEITLDTKDHVIGVKTSKLPSEPTDTKSFAHMFTGSDGTTFVCGDNQAIQLNGEGGISASVNNGLITFKNNVAPQTGVVANATVATPVEGKFYPVTTDETNRLAVSVPWTDHTYTLSDLGGVSTDTFNANMAEASEALSNKVDKVSGKGLSTKDFTGAYETKLNGIETASASEIQAVLV